MPEARLHQGLGRGGTRGRLLPHRDEMHLLLDIVSLDACDACDVSNVWETCDAFVVYNACDA